MADNIYIGVDLGGTTVTAGVVKNSEIINLKTVPTGSKRPAEEIVDTIFRLIGDVSGDHIISGIGVGVPNPAGPESDRLFLVENIHALEDFPLRSKLQDHFGVPVVLENDANCMALGEHRAGALKGCRHCVCVTLGTGLGCGIIVNGVIYRGSGYCAGEIWNIPWGNGKTLEEMTGLQGLTELIHSLMGKQLAPETMLELYQRADKSAIKVFNMYGESVGHIMVMLLSTLDPERIAVGGGISQSFDAFKPGMNRVVRSIWGRNASGKIVPAVLSGKAAILGAAVCIKEATGG